MGHWRTLLFLSRPPTFADRRLRQTARLSSVHQLRVGRPSWPRRFSISAKRDVSGRIAELSTFSIGDEDAPAAMVNRLHRRTSLNHRGDVHHLKIGCNPDFLKQ